MAFTTRSDRKFELLPKDVLPVGPGQYDPKDSALVKRPESFAPFGSTSERIKVAKVSQDSKASEPEGIPAVLLVGNQATPGPDTYSPKLRPSYTSSIPRKRAPFTTTGRRSELLLQASGAPVFYQTVYQTASKAEAKTFGPKPHKIYAHPVTSAPSIPVEMHEDHKAPIYDVAPSLAHTRQAAPRACFGRSSRFGEISTASSLGPGSYYQDASTKRRRWFEQQPSAAFRSTTDRAQFASNSDTLAAPGSYDVRGSLIFKRPTADVNTEHQFFSSSAPRFTYKELENSMRLPGPGEYGDPGANDWVRGNRGVKISAPLKLERPQPRQPDLDFGGLGARTLEGEESVEEPAMRTTKNILAKSGSLAFLSHSERFPERKSISTPSDIVIPEPGEYEAGHGTPEEADRPVRKSQRPLLRIPIRHEIRKQEKLQPPPVGYYEAHKFPDFNIRKRLADKEGFLTTSHRFRWETSKTRVLVPDTSVLDIIDPRNPNACVSITVDPHSDTSIAYAPKKTADKHGLSRGLADMSNPRGFLSSVAREKLLDVVGPKRAVPGPADYDIPRAEFVKKNFNTLFGDVA